MLDTVIVDCRAVLLLSFDDSTMAGGKCYSNVIARTRHRLCLCNAHLGLLQRGSMHVDIVAQAAAQDPAAVNHVKCKGEEDQSCT